DHRRGQQERRDGAGPPERTARSTACQIEVAHRLAGARTEGARLVAERLHHAARQVGDVGVARVDDLARGDDLGNFVVLFKIFAAGGAGGQVLVQTLGRRRLQRSGRVVFVEVL